MNIWLGFSCLWFEHAFRVEKEEEEKTITFVTYQSIYCVPLSACQ